MDLTRSLNSSTVPNTEDGIRRYFKIRSWNDVDLFTQKIQGIRQSIQLTYPHWEERRTINYIISNYPEFHFGLINSYQNAYRWSYPEVMQFRTLKCCRNKVPSEIIPLIMDYLF